MPSQSGNLDGTNVNRSLRHRDGTGAGHAQQHESRRLVSAKDLLWLVYLYPLRWLVRGIGPRSSYTLGRVIEPLFQAIASGRRKEALAWMREALPPQASPDALDRISRSFVSNAVFRALDDLHLTNPAVVERLPDPQIQGRPHLDAALAAGNGVLLISGHFYANRLGKRLLGRMGFPVLSVRNGRPPDFWMGHFGRKWLQPRYIQFLHSVIGDEVFIDDPQCSLKIFQRLRSGGLVNVHVDVGFATDVRRTQLLGRSRRFGTGLLEIIRLSGCAVLPMLCLGNLRHCAIRLGPPLELAAAESRQGFADANISRITNMLEEMIREKPEEWELWKRL